MANIISIKVNAETALAFQKLQEIGNKITGLGSFISGIGAQVAAAFTVGALVRFTEAQIDAADKTGKMAQQAGIATEELSKLLYAAKLSDVGASELGIGIKELNRNIAEGADEFTRLGIALKNEDGSLRSTSEIIGDIAEKFSGYEDGANKSALAVELFGRSGASMIPMLNGGRKAIVEAGQELEKFGGVITDEAARSAEAFNDDLTRLRVTVNGVFLTFAQDVLPMLKRLTEYLKEVKNQTSGAVGPAQVLATVFRIVATAASLTATSFLNVGQAIGVFEAAHIEVLKLNFGKALEMIKEGYKEIEARTLKTKDTLVAIWDSAKPVQPEAANAETKATAPGALLGNDKSTQARLAGELAVQQALDAIEATKNENRFKQGLQGYDDFYSNKMALAREASRKETEILRQQLEEADRLLAVSKNNPQQFSEAQANRSKIEAEIEVVRLKFLNEWEKINGEWAESELSAASEISDARILIAEQTGQKLIAAELKIQQQFAALRKSLVNSTDPNRPSDDAVNAAEKTALAQARVADQIERQTRAQTAYQQAVQTTDALLESGQITQREATDKNNTAAREYLDLLNKELVVLGEIAATNPDLDGLLEKIRAINLEKKNTKPKTGRDDFGGQVSKQFDDTKEGIPTLAEDFGSLTVSPFVSAIGSIKEGIDGLIDGTKKWSDVLQGIGTGVLKGIASSFSQMVADFIAKTVMMGVKWVATHLFMSAAKTATDAANLTSHVVTETGMTVATASNSLARGQAEKKEGLQAAFTYAVKAAKSASEIPYVGWILGPIVFASVLATTVAASAIGGFKDGGYTGTGSSTETAGVVHKDEFVMPSSQRAIFPILEKIRTGSLNAQTWANSVRLSSPFTSDPEVASKYPGIGGNSGSGSGSPNVNVQGHSLKVGFVGVTENDMRRYMEEEMPDKILKIVRGMKHELGAT